MAFRSVNNDYTITTEGELGAILKNFDPDMIFNVLENNMNMKYREYEFNLTNLVISYEYSFKELVEAYGDDREISATRNDVYALIIQRICKFHNINIIDNNINIDLFTLASTLYELLVSGFTAYISRFITAYIMREKESLYNMLMTMEEDKKLKNNSILYSKKLYNTDPKLAALHAYIPKVINNICSFNISLYEYIQTAYKYETEKANFLISVLENNEDFFPTYVVPFIVNHSVRIITDTRLTLQSELGITGELIQFPN